jgi:enoyl-CoA hydratase/carnithine racemase
MSPGAAQPVRLEREGDLAIAVLADPPLNLFTERTFERLREVRDEVAASDARAMVLRAEGDVFTGGVDVHTFARIGDSAEGRELAQQGVADLSCFEALPIPTLALVHGLCLTAGLEIALGCDMIWAAEGARFGLVERVVGLTPFGGGVQRMAARAGPARAREFVMTGGLYPAEKMLEWGVVNRVLAPQDLLEKGLKFGRELAAGPTVAHAATKRLVRAFLDDGVEGADRVTAETAAPLFDTEDLKGAVESFLSDGPGKATFEGR